MSAIGMCLSVRLCVCLLQASVIKTNRPIMQTHRSSLIPLRVAPNGPNAPGLGTKFVTFILLKDLSRCILKIVQTRMWANAQRDGRPAEYRWHPLFNAAKFG